MKKVVVVEVKEPPAIGKVEMMQGIRTKDAAEKWAGMRGYPTVYWLKSRERVYAEKASRVDLATGTVELQSDRLLQLSERGVALLDFILLLALFLVLVFVLTNIPW